MSLDHVIALARGKAAAVHAYGNTGVYPKRLAAAFQAVYTFEPVGDVFRLLMKGAPEPNIVPLCAAVGVRRDPVAGGMAPTLLIDDLGLPACDLLSLHVHDDTEHALLGAWQMLERCRPVVALAPAETPESVVAFLARRGYERHTAVPSDVAVYLPREWGAA